MSKILWWNRPQTEDCVLRNDTGEYWRVRVGKMEQILHNDYLEVLREYFLAERDKELGRRRDPVNPDQVIYPSHTNVVHVLDESTGRVGVWSRFEEDNAFTGDRSGEATAKRYFEEYPLKPWRDAEPGEVWRVTYRTPSANETANPVMTCVMDGPNVSFFNEWRLHTVHYSGIESAERIWPETKEDDDE